MLDTSKMNEDRYKYLNVEMYNNTNLLKTCDYKAEFNIPFIFCSLQMNGRCIASFSNTCVGNMDL